MANKVKIQATTEDFEKGSEDQGEFVVPQNGYYILQLKEANHGFSKKRDGSGEVDKTKERIECIYEIVGVGTENNPVEENYGNVWDYVSFSKAAGWSRGQWLKAMGLSDGSSDFDDTVDLDDILGNMIIARLGREKGQTKDDPPRARIKSMTRFDAMEDAASAFDAAEDDGEGDADEDDGDGDYTQEELEGMENKALGVIAKEEFSLDPNDSIVKVRGKVNAAKSKAKLIEAILEAQDADAGGDGEDGDEESPF